MMKLLLISFFLTFHFLLSATHIVGGVAHYEIVNNTDSLTTEVEITFTLYRDALSGGADFDADAFFGAFISNQDGTTSFFDMQVANPSIVTDSIIGSQFRIQSAEYIVRFDFPKGSDYIISYQRCCRAENISNIDNPSASPIGMAIQLEIFAEALELDINSPSLSELPFAVAASGQPIEYQLPLESDTLTEVTTFFSSVFITGGFDDATGPQMGCCSCLRPDPMSCNPPYDGITYLSNFSGINPLGDQNDIVINTEGVISGIINISSIYQYGIVIENTLNGTLLSRQLLDNAVNTLVSTSTKEAGLSLDFEIFPNPVSDILNIAISNSQNLTLEITDTEGRSILKSELNQKNNIVRLDQLDTGIYFASLSDRKQSYLLTKKFVIE